jgi:hypothetical protein
MSVFQAAGPSIVTAALRKYLNALRARHTHGSGPQRSCPKGGSDLGLEASLANASQETLQHGQQQKHCRKASLG